MTYYVSSGTLNPTHSLTPLPTPRLASDVCSLAWHSTLHCGNMSDDPNAALDEVEVRK